MEAVDRIAQLLRSAGAPLVTLAQLTRGLDALQDDLLAGEGLRAILTGRPDRFVLLERPALFAGAEHWPQEERTAYAEALRAAGFETQPLVGEAAPGAFDDAAAGEPDSPVSRVASSLAQIADAAPPDGLLRERLWDALPLAEATMRVLAEAWRAKREMGVLAADPTAQQSG